jgi:hypothetical protein
MAEESETEKSNREFIRRKLLFEVMVETEAWKELTKILTAQKQSQLNNILTPPSPEMDGINRTLLSEYQKGVVFGIQLTMATPYATINTAKEIISDINRQNVKDEKHDDRIELDNDGHELPAGATVRDLSGDNQ